MAAAAFARSIGLRDYSAFTAVIEGSHIAATHIKSPKTARLQWLMSDAEIADFRNRFVTPTMTTQETGRHRNTIFAVFSGAGVKPFQPDGPEAGPIYLREVAMRVTSNHLKKR
ncbi:hypothetical protein [Rhodovulum sulfidophilum]|uniref:Uncharacterized protein n=1 Tax=Rhodovulum sulfidophilum TaxID=35806 RepID=A0ABS1RQ39_RHOSU|nr:hypothetical protein [Rhodovulum sulfidophilum]MBL3608192.1 hypothetical protein [Rhodovulum sulfidophilum]MCE8457986.1 hypothetical protein [Rhodovulum sulfidophilum]